MLSSLHTLIVPIKFDPVVSSYSMNDFNFKTAKSEKKLSPLSNNKNILVDFNTDDLDKKNTK